MDENLITKKDLLSATGISYGSLYRWKRMDLIPDEWFIHRATFTGQETFFPRDKIVERINKIIQLKETMSLDEMAELWSPVPKPRSFSLEDIAGTGIASPAVIDIYLANYGEFGEYDNHRLLSIYLCSRLMALGTLSRSEVFEAVDLFELAGRKSSTLKIALTRKLGVCTCMVTNESSLVIFDRDVAVIAEILVRQLQAELNELLRKDDDNE